MTTNWPVPLKRYLLWALVGVVGSLALVLAPLIEHERQLCQLRSEFVQVKHPANTRPLGVVASVGLLVGNGNHCDYFVGEARATAEVWEDVASHYRVIQKQTHLELEVKEVQGAKLGREMVGRNFPYQLENLSAWDIDNRQPGEWIYIVYAMQSGAAGYDMRCH